MVRKRLKKARMTAERFGKKEAKADAAGVLC